VGRSDGEKIGCEKFLQLNIRALCLIAGGGGTVPLGSGEKKFEFEVVQLRVLPHQGKLQPEALSHES